MDGTLLWSIVGAIGGIAVAAFVGWISYRRQFPKRGIEWWVESTRLIATQPGAIQDLEVRVAGIAIDDPYLNALTIYSNSRADIPSSSFDPSRPTMIRVSRGGALRVVGEEGSEIAIGGGRGEGFEWAELTIEPQLVRKRASGHLTFVSSGKPVVRVDAGLIDVEVTQRSSDRTSHWLFAEPFYIRGIVAALVVSLVAGVTLLLIEYQLL